MSKNYNLSEQERFEKLEKVLPAKMLEIYKKFSHNPSTPLMKDVQMCLKKELLLRKLREYRGHIGKACEFVGITRKTFENYMVADPIFLELVQEIREFNLDDAEEKILDNIDKGYEASIIFYLKTQGRKRGYSETYQQDVDEKRVQEQIAKQTTEQIERELMEIRESLGLNPDVTSTDLAIEEHEQKMLPYNKTPEFEHALNGKLNEREEDFSVDSLFETEEERLKFLAEIEKENKDIKPDHKLQILKLDA